MSRFVFLLNRKYDDVKISFFAKKIFIRKLIDKQKKIRILNLSKFLRDELKIEIYEKYYFEKKFVLFVSYKIKFFFMFAFIDAFNL